jgi:hypothetical protein
MMAWRKLTIDGNTCSFTNTPNRELKEQLGHSSLLDIVIPPSFSIVWVELLK